MLCACQTPQHTYFPQYLVDSESLVQSTTFGELFCTVRAIEIRHAALFETAAAHATDATTSRDTLLPARKAEPRRAGGAGPRGGDEDVGRAGRDGLAAPSDAGPRRHRLFCG